MPSRMRVRRRSRRRTPLISALSECREEGQQIVGWAEAVENLAGRFDLFEGLLLHLQVGFDINVGRLQTFMAQPKGDHCYVHAGLQQMHGRRVA